MSRPAQLEQQIARVKELQAEMLEQTETPVEEEKPTDAPPVEPVVQGPVTISKEEYDRLEQKYRTLQGMHNADTTRLRTELSAATNAIYNLEQRIAEAERVKTSSEPAKYVTAQDEEEYGETLEMVRRASREEAENIFRKSEDAYLNRIANLEAEITRMRTTVEPVVQDLSTSQANQAIADFWNSISTNVPNWRTVNDNQEFKAWLLEEDAITGATRQQFLAQAQSELNAARVVRIFKEWERTAAGGQTPAPRNDQTQLEKFVAPGNSRSAPPGDKPKKQWTREEIATFYKDSMLGKYNHRPDQKKKIEDDIFAAQAEGRIS